MVFILKIEYLDFFFFLISLHLLFQTVLSGKFWAHIFKKGGNVSDDIQTPESFLSRF